jgi:hypothetical protein
MNQAVSIRSYDESVRYRVPNNSKSWSLESLTVRASRRHHGPATKHEPSIQRAGSKSGLGQNSRPHSVHPLKSFGHLQQSEIFSCCPLARPESIPSSIYILLRIKSIQTRAFVSSISKMLSISYQHFKLSRPALLHIEGSTPTLTTSKLV